VFIILTLPIKERRVRRALRELGVDYPINYKSQAEANHKIEKNGKYIPVINYEESDDDFKSSEDEMKTSEEEDVSTSVDESDDEEMDSSDEEYEEVESSGEDYLPEYE
jgi:hypothetical protein